MSLKAKDLIGREWVDMSSEELQLLDASRSEVFINGRGRVCWADPARCATVAIHLLGAVAQADIWVRRISGASFGGIWRRPSNIVEGDIDYPLFECMLNTNLKENSYHGWTDPGLAPRLRPNTGALMRHLKDVCDLNIKIIYPVVDDRWNAGVLRWLKIKQIPWDSLAPYPAGAESSHYLDGCSGYIDNHPERVRRASERNGIKTVSLLKNAWNAVAGVEQRTPAQIMQQYG